MKAACIQAPVDLVRAEAGVKELATRQNAVLQAGEAPNPASISSTFQAHSQESALD
jgi:hypothetical protein